MNAITTLAPEAITWPPPQVGNVCAALDDATCRIERLRALIDSNTTDLNDAFVEGTSILSDWHKSRAYSIWMIFILASEKLAELDALVDAISTVAHEDRRSVKPTHEERQNFACALQAYQESEAAPVTAETPDIVFDHAAEMFQVMLRTPAPDLRSLHEKLSVLDKVGGWHTDGVRDALFNDIESLARRYEGAGQLAATGA